MRLSNAILETIGLNNKKVSDQLDQLINSELREEELWQKVCDDILPNITDFSKHKVIHSYIFQNWDEKETIEDDAANTGEQKVAENNKQDSSVGKA